MQDHDANSRCYRWCVENPTEASLRTPNRPKFLFYKHNSALSGDRKPDLEPDLARGVHTLDFVRLLRLLPAPMPSILKTFDSQRGIPSLCGTRLRVANLVAIPSSSQIYCQSGGVTFRCKLPRTNYTSWDCAYPQLHRGVFWQFFWKEHYTYSNSVPIKPRLFVADMQSFPFFSGPHP